MLSASRTLAAQPSQIEAFRYRLVLENSGDTIAAFLPEGGFVSFDVDVDAHPSSHRPGITYPRDGGFPVTIQDLARHRLATFSGVMNSAIDQVLNPHKNARRDTRFLRSTFLPALQAELKKQLGEDVLVESQTETMQSLEFEVTLIILDSDVNSKKRIQQTILLAMDDSFTELGLRERTGLLHYGVGLEMKRE